MPSETSAAPIWVLLGVKRGDNQQLLAIAEALKLPFRAIQLTFNRAAEYSPLLLRSSHLSWSTDTPLEPPWPRAVLAAGRRSVPAARWIRRQSGRRTRLIHVNRPRAPLSWFDLIVTTPQFALPERPNVLVNLMPFVPLSGGKTPTVALPSRAANLPRPWTAVLVGGNSAPYVLDEPTAVALADTVNDHVRSSGGSAWVIDSPRTPAGAMSVIEQALKVPAYLSRSRDGENLYGLLLSQADRFIVTADSASMLAEALLSARPVTLFDQPGQPEAKRRFDANWSAAAARAPTSMTARLFEAAVDLGLVTRTSNQRLLHRALEDAGMFEEVGRARERAEREQQTTLLRIAPLVEGRW